MLQSLLKKFGLIFILFFQIHCSFAQMDTQFSMFYSVPIYLNPAFAGSRHANRALIDQRFQWPNQAGNFFTTQFSFDTYSSKYNSGFGLLALQDYAGNGVFSSTSFGLQYAYELKLNSRFTARAGIQGGFIQRSLNAAGPLPSQVTDNGINSTQGVNANIINPDISSGVLLYDTRLWASISLHHINSPNESIIRSNSADANLPRKFTLAAGYKIPIPLFGSGNKGGRKTAPDLLYITPTFTYKHQGPADQLDLGVYATRKWLITGFWYRGIPLKGIEDVNGSTFRNNESIVALIGVSYNGWGFGYAYDLTISSQGLGTGGSHEFNLSYVFRLNHKKGPVKNLPCPDFEYDILQKAGR